MTQIKSGHVKLRSKYIFWAEKLGVGGALVFSILLAILFFNLVLYYLRSSDSIGYLSFGNFGLTAFLDSFPYLLVIVATASMFVAGLIVKKSDFTYKQPFGLVALGLVVLVILVGTVLTYSNIMERLENSTDDRRPMGMFFNRVVHRGLGERHGGITGQVIDQKGQFIFVKTPRSFKKIDISHLDVIDPALKTGDFVMVVGDADDEIFTAFRLRIISEQEFQMVRRAVRRFNPTNKSFKIYP
ncbi:MAG: hypothetical protein ACD_72C00344G0001 [uncultured bacterium]|nr:MAG: hypothetical protein ACD_72C00344G0001 [uncultured bacterium]